MRYLPLLIILLLSGCTSMEKLNDTAKCSPCVYPTTCVDKDTDPYIKVDESRLYAEENENGKVAYSILKLGYKRCGVYAIGSKEISKEEWEELVKAKGNSK